MTTLKNCLVLALHLVAALTSDGAPCQDIKSFHELSALDIDKKEVKFSALKDQVKCG